MLYILVCILQTASWCLMLDASFELQYSSKSMSWEAQANSCSTARSKLTQEQYRQDSYQQVFLISKVIGDSDRRDMHFAVLPMILMSQSLVGALKPKIRKSSALNPEP